MARWQLDRRVPALALAAFILAAGAYLVGHAVWAGTINQDIAQVKATLAERAPLVERFVQTEQATKDFRGEVIPRLDRMDAKLDRLVERQAPPP